MSRLEPDFFRGLLRPRGTSPRYGAETWWCRANHQLSMTSILGSVPDTRFQIKPTEGLISR